MPGAASPSPLAPIRRQLFAVLGLALLAVPPPARAAAGAPAILRVGLEENPPFSTYQNGRWTGLSVDVWTSIAGSLGETVEWRRAGRGDIPAQLAARRLDVGPASVISTAGVRRADYSPPLLASGLAIATSEDPGWDYHALFASLINSRLASIVGSIILVNLIVGFILWRLERRHNPSGFGGGTTQGLASGVWCAVSTMTTVGYGDKVPITWAGRLLCFVMMLSGVVIISILTASASSALTVAHLRPRVRSAADLKTDLSAVVAGSAGADYLESQGMRRVAFANAAAAEAALERGAAAAFVDDRIQLRAWYHDHPRGITILPLSLEEVYYAYPLPSDPAERRRLAAALQSFLESSRWRTLQLKYLTQ